MSDHAASRSALAEAQRERARQAESEVDRLKAENASLLESLRDKTAAIDRMKVEWDATARRGAREVAAAEQRAEAAEKERDEARECVRLSLEDGERGRHYWKGKSVAAEQRHTALTAFAREVAEQCDCAHHADMARAALHDEERSAPPLPVEGNTPLRESVTAAVDGLSRVEAACARALAGDQKDWRTLRTTLTLIIERTQKMRASFDDALSVAGPASDPAAAQGEEK